MFTNHAKHHTNIGQHPRFSLRTMSYQKQKRKTDQYRPVLSRKKSNQTNRIPIDYTLKSMPTTPNPLHNQIIVTTSINKDTNTMKTTRPKMSSQGHLKVRNFSPESTQIMKKHRNKTIPTAKKKQISKQRTTPYAH